MIHAAPLRSGSKRVRLISAVESAECGLACVAMIANHHGHDVDLLGLRKQLGVSASGARLRDIIGALDSLALQSRPVRLDMDGLGELALPAILHWDMDHFVVLDGIAGRRFRVFDPGRGERLLTAAEFSSSFTGVALEISKSANFAARRQREILPFSAIWSSLTGWSGPASQILLFTVCLQIVLLGIPVLTQILIDDAVAAGDISFISILIAGLFSLVIFQSLVEFSREWAVETLRQSLSYQITGNLVRHLLRLPSAYFERRGTADIISRLQSSNSLRDILTKSGLDGVSGMIMLLVIIVVLFAYSIKITLFVLATVSAHVAVHLITYSKLRDRLRRQITSVAFEQGHLMESVRSASVMKLLGTESRREMQWRSLFADVINAALSASRLKLFVNAITNLIAGIRLVGVLGLGAYAVINDDNFSLGMLYAFMAMQQMFSQQSVSTISNFIQLRSIDLHLERISDIALARHEYETSEPVTFSDLSGPLELQDVSFQYGNFGPKVLDMVSLKVEPREFITIIGSSGSGKSTLLKLLLGLEMPTGGLVLANGQPLVGETLRAWRHQVGFVLQDDKLVSGSIAENIAAFDPDMDLVRVEEAAKAAQVHADIIKMPMQYRSLIGEMGSALSGGQRQRIMLARALYRKPSVLIMDEGTANLDAISEQGIAELVAGLDICRISVSHRPAMVRRADRVLVLEGGRLWPHRIDTELV